MAKHSTVSDNFGFCHLSCSAVMSKNVRCSTNHNDKGALVQNKKLQILYIYSRYLSSTQELYRNLKQIEMKNLELILSITMCSEVIFKMFTFLSFNIGANNKSSFVSS